MIEHREHRSGRARLGIGGGEDQAIDARMDHGSSAHGTRLEGDVESAAVEPVIAERDARLRGER